MDDLDLVAHLNARDDDGQVHFAILPGSVAKNRHLSTAPLPERRLAAREG
jgi:hypothetical protein